jgi:hypothetical protein
VIPVGYGAFALLAGGALGVVPGLVTGDWKTGATRDQLWVAIILGAAAVASLVTAEVVRRGRDQMAERNGTAYIIQEQARFWTPQDAARFRAGIRRQFARVVQVPGPAEVDRGWDWPLDGAARDWDGKVDELVRAFRVLSIDESRQAVTPNGVFLWAWWAVAAGFGMRATAADRDLELDVWQRPSKARSGEVEPRIWAQRPHRFGSAAAISADGTLPPLTEHVWDTGLTISRHGKSPAGAARVPASVLLLRFSGRSWGPLPDVTVPVPDDDRLCLHVTDAAGVVPSGVVQAVVHELRCVPPDARFPWEDFPALAAGAAAWIERKTNELTGHVLLLGAVLPQEAGLGLGILAGQESRRAGWPVHLWPIIAEPVRHDLVIPRLDLGSAALDLAPVGGRGA